MTWKWMPCKTYSYDQIDHTPEYEPDRRRIYIAVANGLMTVNEARSALGLLWTRHPAPDQYRIAEELGAGGRGWLVYDR